MVAIDHVVEIIAFTIPKARLKRGTTFFEDRCQRGENCAPIASAFNQSAWISTGLPMRGVISRPSTRASIQVS